MAQSQPSKTSNTAGALYLFSIGLFLFFLGAFFCWLMWNSFAAAKDTREWEEVPCLLIQSELSTRIIGTSPEEYRWKVAYKFQHNGQDYIGEHYKPRGQRWKKDRDEVKALTEEYPVGLQTFCFVNPNIGAELEPGVPSAVMAHDTLAAGYSIWFPALFSVGGIGIMIGAVRKKK